MLSSQEDQAERVRTLLNDARVREQREQERRVFADQSLPNQASTFHQHAVADAAMPLGRFSAISNAQIVGQGAQYPPAGVHQRDPVGTEPPLGYSVDAMEPSTVLLSSSGEATRPTSSDDPSPLGRDDVGPFSQSGDPTTEGHAPPSASPRGARGLVGSPPAFRR